MAAPWLRQGKPVDFVLLVFRVAQIGTTNLFANSCTIIDPVLQIFILKLHRALRSEPFFSIILPMERPGLWL